jgi:MoxR-like ATPase
MTFGQLAQLLGPDLRLAQHSELFENGRPTFRGMGYEFNQDMVASADVALELGRPLLVAGDPGVGKTELGYAIARGLGVTNIYFHSVKSTSDAKDLFYTYDALQRLRDSRLEEGGARDVGDYVDFQAMGLAILGAHERSAIEPLLRGKHIAAWKAAPAPRRSVVVIDEIDKAPKDFPNDLLHEIEAMSFRIKEFPATPETPPIDTIPMTRRPIVVITSNEERQLPDAFLRRCVFHEIQFPKEPQLKKIVASGLEYRLRRMGWSSAAKPILDETRISKLIDLLVEFREKEPDKKPGIAEMLDAAALLFKYPASELSIVKPTMVKLKRDGDTFDKVLEAHKL